MSDLIEGLVVVIEAIVVFVLIVVWFSVEQVLLGLYFACHPHPDTDDFLSWW